MSDSLNANGGALPTRTGKGSPADAKSMSNPGSASGSITSGMAVNDTQFSVSIPAIQRNKDLTTRSLGDVAAASLNRAADNGGPRKDAGQFRSTSKLDTPATQTTVDDTTVGG